MATEQDSQTDCARATTDTRQIHLRLDLAAGVATSLLVATTLVEIFIAIIPFIRVVLMLFVLFFGLGSITLAVIGLKPSWRATWLLYSLGIGSLMLMMIGLALEGLLQLVSYEQSLSEPALLGGVVVTVSCLILLAHRRNASLAVDMTVPVTLDAIPAQVIAVLLLPLWSILAVSLLNAQAKSLPLLLLFLIIAIIPIAVALSYGRERYLPLTVWSIALAVLLHKSLWAGYVYGGHASVVTFYETQGFSLGGFENLLQNAVLLPAMARLGGVDILTQLKVILPFIVAFIPVTLFVTFRRYTNGRTAFLGSILFVFAHPFYYQYPSVPRASIPVFFFALIGLVIADQNLDLLRRRGLAAVFAVGLAVSHYGTAYYVMFALLGTLVLLAGLGLKDPLLERLRETSRRVPDGGKEQGLSRLLGWWNGRLREYVVNWGHVLTVPFILLYIVTVLGWYLFTGGGKKFTALTEHIINAYRSLFTGFGQGSTATRLIVNYNTQSIQLSKYLYVLVGILVGVGLFVVFVRRLLHSDQVAFDDEYLALGILVLLLFGGTFILSGEWGGGRPMMIVLSYDAVFAVIAVLAIGNYLRRALVRIFEYAGLPMESITGSLTQVRRRQRVVFAIILAVFLLLNSGVVAALVLGGYAPSNVPLSGDVTVDEYPRSQVGGFIATDIQMHVWMADHMDRSIPPYSDRFIYYQATDFYNGEIAARASKQPYRYKPNNNLQNVMNPGYILFGGRNTVEGKVSVSHVEDRPLSEYSLSLANRNRVYTNGRATVYFGNRSSTS